MPLGLSDNLFKRIVSAVSLLPPVLFVLWAGGWWFTAFLALGGALMALEWASLTGFRRPSGAVLAALIVGLCIYAQLEQLDIEIIFIGLAAISGICLFASSVSILRKPAWWMLGIVYVGLPIVALWWMRSADFAMIVFWVFLVTWATDIGGYFAGKGIGGPKLAPKISPKKTWAGLLGGMALSAIVALVLNVGFGLGASLISFLLISSVLAVVSQIGDLTESAVKRHFDVKDSGGLIPGHGGLLDRVDGLVTVAPVVALILILTPSLLVP